MASEPTLDRVARDLCKALGYEYVKYMSSGRYKETYCIHNSKQVYALKICKPDGSSARTEREIAAMKSFDDPNIVRLKSIGTFLYDGMSYLYLLEEFLDGGSLGEAIEKRDLSKAELVKISIDIAHALVATYHSDIVHRDIKPDNIMFSGPDNKAVLVDFGLVRMLNEESLTQSFLVRGPGTPAFGSPEQLNNEKDLIDWRSDQFSLGVTLYYSYYKTFPFSETNPTEHVDAILQHSRLPIKTKAKLEKDGLEPIITMLSRYPVERYRTPEILLRELGKV